MHPYARKRLWECEVYGKRKHTPENAYEGLGCTENASNPQGFGVYGTSRVRGVLNSQGFGVLSALKGLGCFQPSRAWVALNPEGFGMFSTLKGLECTEKASATRSELVADSTMNSPARRMSF